MHSNETMPLLLDTRCVYTLSCLNHIKVIRSATYWNNITMTQYELIGKCVMS